MVGFFEREKSLKCPFKLPCAPPFLPPFFATEKRLSAKHHVAPATPALFEQCSLSTDYMNSIYSIEQSNWIFGSFVIDSLIDQYLSLLAPVNTPLELSLETSLLPPSESSPSFKVPESSHCKPGRKRKPVPTNPEDIHREIELKRFKNTEAARRCRQRKNQRIDELEFRVNQLEAENQRLMAIIRSINV